MSPKSNDQLIQALQTSSAYPHEVDCVELLETHISWILLAGRFAYKVKKPVDLGFVDFTTLERRKFFCEEELRLNRRLAPHLYFDVVPIAGTPQSPKVGGPGEPLEYAVQMQRFPADALLTRVLERSELQPAHIDGLADEVAEFHARVEIAEPDSPFGSPERVRDPVVENFRHLDRNTNDDEVPSKLQHLRRWSDCEFESLKSTFAARKRDGFVRECHGDLHLGNMILDGDRIVVFDCLEFNASLRWIDVISEVAFCAMDLEDRGRADFAHRFLNGYLERTGDYAGLAVMRYYLVYRAMVRAKVARIRADQESQDEASRKKSLSEARGYLELACSYAAPNQPALFFAHGFSGSGKTMWSQKVIEQCGAIRIRSDVERKRLFGRDEAALYSAAATAQTYEKLAELTQTILRAGFSTIVDATFLKKSQRDLFRSLAQRLNVPFRILDFRAAEAVLKQRIVARQQAGSDASDADLEVLAHQLQSHDALTDDELSKTIAVDTQSPNAEQQFLDALRAISIHF